MKRLAWLLAALGCLSYNSASYPPTDLKIEVNNCIVEISTLQQRAERLEQTIEELHKQLLDNTATATLQARIGKIETTLQNLTDDLKKLQKQGNESATALAQLRQSAEEATKNSATHADNINNLQTALRSLMDLHQQKSSLKISNIDLPSSAATYKIKPGDTLGKIAKELKTSIAELKKCNDFKEENKIIVGQEINVPRMKDEG